MNILLVNPPFNTRQRYGPDMAQFGPTNEPLGLAYIGSYLERDGHHVVIWDGMVEEPDSLIPLVDDADLIGVTILTPMYQVAKQTIEKIHKRRPKTPIVAGGAHPTILPQDTLRDIIPLSHVVVGEGERAMAYIASCMDEKKPFIPRVVNMNPIEDLDDLPIPARSLLPMHRYQMTRSRSRYGHAYTVSVARGCPFNCAFCCRIFGKKVRFHSVERIIEEIKILVNLYGAKEINLEADTLTINGHFVSHLCSSIIEEGLHEKVRFTCESRVDTVNEGMLSEMKKAGVWQISYGVESGNQRLLDLIDKGITIERIRKTFEVTKRVGINIRAFYILGLPTETKEESERTVYFARELGADWSQFTLCTPFPGTKLFDLCTPDKDWTKYQTHGGWADSKLSYVPEGRTEEEMKAVQKWAYRVVYLAPRTMYRKLKEVRSTAIMRSYADGFLMLLRSGSDSKLKRVPAEDLRRFAGSHYVDSPVYFNSIWPIRELNWGKLGAILDKTIGDFGTCLDLGCGNGVLLPSLSKMFDRVIGVDLHVGAAKNLVEEYGLNNVELIKADGYKLPMANDTINTIICTSSLEHFKEIDELLLELHRVLKPRGMLYFIVPSENIIYRIGRKIMGYKKPKDHYHTGKQIDAWLRDSPLRIMETESYPAFPPIYRMGVCING